MHINICEKYGFSQLTSTNNCTINKTFVKHSLIMQTNFLPKTFFHVLLRHLSWTVYSFLLFTYYKNSKKTNKPWIIALGDDPGMCSRRFTQAFPCAFHHLNHTLLGQCHWLLFWSCAEVEHSPHLAKPNWFAFTIFTFWCFQPVFRPLQFVHALPEWYCIMPDSPALSSFRFTAFDPACHGLSFFVPALQNPTTFCLLWSILALRLFGPPLWLCCGFCLPWCSVITYFPLSASYQWSS